MPRLAVLFGLAIVLAACGEPGSTSSTAPTTTAVVAPASGLAEDDLVLTYEETGGCFMMGPNCRLFVLRADGSFDLFRAGDLLAEPEMTGSIEASLVNALMDAGAATDFEALRAGLGPGTCNACVDGIDIVVVFHAAAGEPEFRSASVEFDGSHPAFVSMEEAVDAMSAASELPTVTR